MVLPQFHVFKIVHTTSKQGLTIPAILTKGEVKCLNVHQNNNSLHIDSNDDSESLDVILLCAGLVSIYVGLWVIFDIAMDRAQQITSCGCSSCSCGGTSSSS